MSKQHKHNRTPPDQKLLKSLYRRERIDTYPPTTPPQKNDSSQVQKHSQRPYHPSLPKPDPFPNKYQLQTLSRIVTPKSQRKSYTPKGLKIETNHQESLKKIQQKSNPHFNPNRYSRLQADQISNKSKVSPLSQIPIDGRKKRRQQPQARSGPFGEARRSLSGEARRKYLQCEEYGKFGQRFPERFRRIGLLGRGGFSLVWLGIHKSSKKRVAVKQILTKNPHETHMKEIWFCSYFFQKGGQPREEFKSWPGISNICRLYTYEIEKQDAWLYYELCDESLGNSLFDLKAESINGERIYKVEYGDLLHLMRADQSELKKIIVEIAKALLLMNSHNIVHSDLKTENIMLKTRKGQPVTHGEGYIRGVKLIDFGSSFLFTNLRQFSMATPEYMPPEILNYILFQNNMEFDKAMLAKMSNYKNPWTIDIWSLGCILLEIVSGVPLWMSVKTKVQNRVMATGLFAVKNRVFNKIIKKQVEVIHQLDYHLKEHNYSGIVLCQELREALKAMLCLQPQKRISPWRLLALLGVDCQKPTIPSF